MFHMNSLFIMLLFAPYSIAYTERSAIEGNNGPRMSIYIGIISKSSNKHLRDSIRNSWALHSLSKIRFFVAREWGQEYTIELENSDYNDIVLMHHKTEYDDNIHESKIEEIIKMSSVWKDFDFVIAIRDDVFVREDLLISFVNELKDINSIIIPGDAENSHRPNILIMRSDISRRVYSNITHNFKEIFEDLNKHKSLRLSEHRCSSEDFITLNRTPYQMQCMYKSLIPRCCNS